MTECSRMVTVPLLSPPIDLASLRLLERRGEGLARAMERLGTGTRVWSVAEDAVAITEAAQFQGDAAALRQALQSGAQAGSLLAVAARGAEAIDASLDRLSSLAGAAEGADLLATERGFLQSSAEAELAAIDATVADTLFASQPLLDGSLAVQPLSYRLGFSDEAALAIDLPDLRSASLLGGQSLDLTSASGAAAARTLLATAGQSVTSALTHIASLQERVRLAEEATGALIEGYRAAGSALNDADIATEGVQYLSDLAEQNASIAMLAQARNMSDGLLALLTRAG